MSFFQIQTHAIPIKHEQATLVRNALGADKMAYSGKPLYTYRAIKNQWTFTTNFLVELEWRFLRALLQGEGHHWAFNDATEWSYSSKGLGITSGTIANGSRYTTTTKFGAGAIRVAANQYVQFNVGYTERWTAMAWVGSTFANHYIVNNAGQKWVDGVRNDGASTPFFTMNSGNFRLGDTGNGAFQYFDDLVIIPEKINNSWAADFGTLANAFSDLPLIRVSGNFTLSDDYFVQGRDVTATMSQGFIDGVWEPNMAEISATIVEHSQD